MDLTPSITNKGFYFSCQQCGKCSSNEQEGYVFLYWPDINAICANLHISEIEFAQKYVSTTNYKYSIWDENFNEIGKRNIPTLILNNEKNENCIFLYSNNEKMLCRIYQSRPLQCQIFPFWNMVVTSEEDFKEACEFCPGIDKKKDDSYLYSPEDIQKRVLKEKEIERNYYLLMEKCNFDINCVYPFLNNVKIKNK